jgi:hypothetical protein
MGLNDEYSRDAYTYEQAYDSEDSDDFDSELHPEDWQDMYSTELLDAWMSIREYLEENYMKINAGYHQFVEFVLEPGVWRTSVTPGIHQYILWDKIKNNPIINNRVESEQFYAWSGNYLEQL